MMRTKNEARATILSAPFFETPLTLILEKNRLSKIRERINYNSFPWYKDIDTHTHTHTHTQRSWAKPAKSTTNPWSSKWWFLSAVKLSTWTFAYSPVAPAPLWNFFMKFSSSYECSFIFISKSRQVIKTTATNH